MGVGDGGDDASACLGEDAWRLDTETRRRRCEVESTARALVHARVAAATTKARLATARSVALREAGGVRLAEELSDERLWIGLTTLLGSREWRDARRRVLERKRVRSQGEVTELKVLMRHDACLEALRRFEARAEEADERGRRRLWLEYRKGSASGDGRGRHYVFTGAGVGYLSSNQVDGGGDLGDGAGGGGGGGGDDGGSDDGGGGDGGAGDGGRGRQAPTAYCRWHV